MKVLKSRIFPAFLLFLIFLCLSGYLFFKNYYSIKSSIESAPLLGTGKKRFEAIAPIISPRGDTVGFIRTIATPTFLASFYSLRNKLLLFTLFS